MKNNSKKGATLIIILITSLAIALMLVAAVGTVTRYYAPIANREDKIRHEINPDYKNGQELEEEQKELEQGQE